jgi:hypothetical protein
MRKILAIIVLSLLLSGNVFAKNGSGDLILSDSVIYDLERYLKYRNPIIFLVTQDGANSSAWRCDFSNCVPTGSMNEKSLCEKRYGKKCNTFAIRRSIKWQNDQTRDAKGKEKRFNSKDSITEIKTKLTALGFYGSNTVERKKTKKFIERKKTKKIIPANNSNLTSRLEQLNKLYKSGALTKDEFAKAKKKLLN